MITDFLALAVRNILHRKRRSWLTVIGIFIGIAAVVSLVSLGQGLEQSIAKEFEQIGSDKLFINPGGDQTQGQITTSIKLTEDDLNAVESQQEVEEAAGIIYASSPAQYKDDQGFIFILGLPPENAELIESSWAMEVSEGREIRSTDTSNIVIGSDVAENVFEDEVEIRSKIEIQDEEFRVVGILEPTGDPGTDQAIIMLRDRAQEITEREDGQYDWIFARMQTGFTPQEAKDNVEQALRDSRNVEEGDEDFTVSTQEDLLESFNQILGVVQGVVAGIASISILVGGVGIMNTMYTSVTQRTREIGVMKAIGATNKQIMTLFLIESGVIGLIGGIIGVVVGLAMSYTAAYFATQAINIQINASFDPVLIAGALLFSFITGTLSGVLPAREAAGLQPAEALRYE